jgi:hypothetical protein
MRKSMALDTEIAAPASRQLGTAVGLPASTSWVMATSPSTHDAGRELGFKHQIFGSNEQISGPGQSDQLPIASIHRTKEMKYGDD